MSKPSRGSNRPWPPEGYVDPRRTQKPPTSWKALLGTAVAFVVVVYGAVRILRFAHATTEAQSHAPGGGNLLIPIGGTLLLVFLLIRRMRH